jgi:hypothetical protein
MRMILGCSGKDGLLILIKENEILEENFDVDEKEIKPEQAQGQEQKNKPPKLDGLKLALKILFMLSPIVAYIIFGYFAPFEEIALSFWISIGFLVPAFVLYIIAAITKLKPLNIAFIVVFVLAVGMSMVALFIQADSNVVYLDLGTFMIAFLTVVELLLFATAIFFIIDTAKIMGQSAESRINIPSYTKKKLILKTLFILSPAILHGLFFGVCAIYNSITDWRVYGFYKLSVIVIFISMLISQIIIAVFYNVALVKRSKPFFIAFISTLIVISVAVFWLFAVFSAVNIAVDYGGWINIFGAVSVILLYLMVTVLFSYESLKIIKNKKKKEETITHEKD